MDGEVTGKFAPTKKTRVPILPARLDWPSGIGTFIVNFSTLDYVVVAFLKDTVNASEFADLMDANRDQIEALVIFYSQPHQRSELTYNEISCRALPTIDPLLWVVSGRLWLAF